MAIQAQTFGTHRRDLSLIDNACGFDSTWNLVADQEQQKPNMTTTTMMMMMMQSQQFQNLSHYESHQNLLFGNNVMYDHHRQSMALTVSAQIEKQRMELDRFIILQNERLRLALQEQRKQQLTLLLKRYESNARVLIERKDEEISKEAKRTSELQEFLGRMEIESQTWQRLAKENEAMVQSLNYTNERLRENNAACFSDNAIDDAGSCCIGDDDYRREDMKILLNHHHKMVCRCCNNKRSCVVILPCRHLCSCRDCDALLESCPVCKAVKKASIEALL